MPMHDCKSGRFFVEVWRLYSWNVTNYPLQGTIATFIYIKQHITKTDMVNITNIQDKSQFTKHLRTKFLTKVKMKQKEIQILINSTNHQVGTCTWISPLLFTTIHADGNVAECRRGSRIFQECSYFGKLHRC